MSQPNRNAYLRIKNTRPYPVAFSYSVVDGQYSSLDYDITIEPDETWEDDVTPRTIDEFDYTYEESKTVRHRTSFGAEYIVQAPDYDQFPDIRGNALKITINRGPGDIDVQREIITEYKGPAAKEAGVLTAKETSDTSRPEDGVLVSGWFWFVVILVVLIIIGLFVYFLVLGNTGPITTTYRTATPAVQEIDFYG
ncbi:Hypothetical protein POVN_LOCUS426 [uncultured virus]|nr:Hypothetical protein POVN_LOCUS426 [uncultured virus]